MKSDKDRNEIGRRDVLRGLGLAAGGAAAAVPLVSGTAEAVESGQEQVKKRYQETDHVKRFYALNRL